MTKLIALRPSTDIIKDTNTVHSTPDFVSHLKQQALIFDQIGYLNFDIQIAMHQTVKYQNVEYPDKEEYEWLKENGIVFDLSTQYGFLLDGEYSDERQKFIKNDWKIQEILKHSRKQKNLGKVFTNIVRVVQDNESIILRRYARKIENVEGVSVVTTLPYINYTSEIPNTRKNECMQIVLNKLPIPSDTTSWEQIIDYRSDETNQKNLLALRRWIRKISSENLSGPEIEEELEFLINEFEIYMKLHKIKANTETLEAILKAPLEIIEDLVKLKFSKIPEPLFALKKRQLSLMEAEINAPGKELAYFIKTKETFQPQE